MNEQNSTYQLLENFLNYHNELEEAYMVKHQEVLRFYEIFQNIQQQQQNNLEIPGLDKLEAKIGEMENNITEKKTYQKDKLENLKSLLQKKHLTSDIADLKVIDNLIKQHQATSQVGKNKTSNERNARDFSNLNNENINSEVSAILKGTQKLRKRRRKRSRKK